MNTWALYIIDILIVATLFMGWAWWQRTKYNKLISPSKEAPFGKILGEWWPETGMRYKVLVPVEANGIEVKSPKGHACPRYFFNKQATWIVKYPEAPFLNLKFLQVDVPLVSWPENNPEPVNPYNRTPIATSSLLGSLRDDDFAAFAMSASRQIQDLETELAKALSNTIKKSYMYIMLFASIGVSLLSAILIYQVFTLLGNMQNAWGM